MLLPVDDVSSFDFSALNYGAIGIFHSFANAYFYLSMTWSQIIHDKEALRKLYEAVYTEISESTEIRKQNCDRGIDIPTMNSCITQPKICVL